MAKIGIVCDEYKKEMFEHELTKAGVSYIIEPVKLNGLIVFTCISEQYIIGPITDKVTAYYNLHFKQKKNN